MKKRLTLLLVTFAIGAFAQKVKTYSESASSYFIKYPEYAFSYKFLEYKTQIDISNTKMIVKSDGKPISETSINENNFTKIRNDSKESYLRIGNLEKTTKSGSGVLDATIKIGDLIADSKMYKSGTAWENKYRISVFLEVPLHITFKDSFSGELVKEDTLNIKYENLNFSDKVYAKDEMRKLKETDFPTLSEAQEASKAYFTKEASNITMAIFDALIGQNQIAGSWNAFNEKYSITHDNTGTLFVEFFKDKKKKKFAEYNTKTEQLKQLAKDIASIAYKDKYIPKEKLTQIQPLSDYYENEIKLTTNEDVLLALKRNLFISYFITDEFEKAALLVNDIKINPRLNSNIPLIKKLGEDKASFEKEKTHSSATYTSKLSYILK